MNLSEYQAEASRTLISKPTSPISESEHMLVWNVMGLAGEVGELVENVKHGVFHHQGIDIDNIKEELGDIMWYVAAVATRVGLDLGLVAQANVDKLRRRYPKGYSDSDCAKRADKKEDIAKVIERESKGDNAMRIRMWSAYCFFVTCDKSELMLYLDEMRKEVRVSGGKIEAAARCMILKWLIDNPQK